MKNLATVTAGLLAIALLLALPYEMGATSASKSCALEKAKMNMEVSILRESLVQEYRAKEKLLADEIAKIDTNHLKETENAKNETDRALASLRTGQLRLRKRFTAEACGTSNLPGAVVGASVDNGPQSFGLQTADVEFLLHFAADADDVATTLRACQAVLKAERQ